MFAIRAHGEQKYGSLPYSYHLAAVENMLWEYNFVDHKYKAAAWLHDTIEDTKVEATDIASQYSTEIAMMVWACTGEGFNRKEKNACIYSRIKKVPEAAPIKTADRMCNILTGIRHENLRKLTMYVNEWEEFSANVGKIMLNSGKNCSIMWNVLEDYMERAKELVKELNEEIEEKNNAENETTEPDTTASSDSKE